MPDTAVFAASFAALYAGHMVGDHWSQSHGQASNKHLRNWTGRRACAGHVATYTVTQLALLLAAGAVTGARSGWPWLAGGMAVSTLTHYWADRRFTLRWLAERLGKSGFYTLGAPRDGHDDNPSLGTGAYALDQSFHIAALFAAALIIAAGAR